MRHFVRTLLITAAFTLAAAAAEGQDMQTYRRIVKELGSARYQGRGYARHGVLKAGNWIEKEFRKAGADTVFQQPFSIDINTFPGSMKMRADGRKLKAGDEFVMREYSPGVHGTYKLYHVDTANYDIDRIMADLATPEYSGAMVVCDFWFPYRHREFKRLEGPEAGNAGFIYTWDTPLKFYKAYGSKVVEKPVVWATAEAVSGTESVTLDVDSKFMANYVSSNIVACVRGRRHDSCFVFTAHYDHLGNLGRHIYCPGVNDNASGTAAIVTLAAHYAEHRPEYDIWFVAFAGEETGLCGSTHFAEHPAMPLGSIKYLFNLDMIGDNNPVQYCECSEQGMAGFRAMERINAEQKLFQGLRMGELAANSDHYPFALKGVPCILFEQEEGDYFQYYHTPKDDMAHFCTESYPKVFRLVTSYVAAAHSAEVPVAVGFDERTDLLAMVWRLAGDKPFCHKTHPAYCQAADAYFAPCKEHPAVAKAREYCQSGIGYDAVAAYGLHLDIAPDGKFSFDKGLARQGDPSFDRWSESQQKDFLPLLEDFYRRSGFRQWYQSTEAVRQEAAGAFEKVAAQIDMRWFDSYFGPLPEGSEVRVLLSILNGLNNYGCSAIKTDGGTRLTPVIGCCMTDGEGHVRYKPKMVLPVVVHEFCHAYCNSLDARHWSQMEQNAGSLFEMQREQLIPQAYTTPQIMVDESFVRACVIRYQLSHGQADAKERLLKEPLELGFLLVPDMVEALGRYEQNRDRYASMADFMPELAKVVDAFDCDSVGRAREEAARQNAAYECSIRDGATDIPSGEYRLTITFSKPMEPHVSLGYGSDAGQFIPLAHGMESIGWDETQTVLTAVLSLEPQTTYSFSIRGEKFKTLDGHSAGKTRVITFTTK